MNSGSPINSLIKIVKLLNHPIDTISEMEESKGYEIYSIFKLIIIKSNINFLTFAYEIIDT